MTLHPIEHEAVAEYSCRLNVEESNPEKKVAEFIHFLPILAYDGSTMKQIDAAGVLDIVLSGTSSHYLQENGKVLYWLMLIMQHLHLMGNEKAMDALMRIEGFRSLNRDIGQLLINQKR